jgi:hypothetical protein
MKSRVIEVRIEQGVLWVGPEAYPLHNIARARTARLIPDRAAAVRGFVIKVVWCVFLGIVRAGALDLARHRDPGRNYHALQEIGTAAFLIAAALFAIGFITLLVRVSRRTFYALVVETAGTPFGVLVSTDQAEVAGLVRTIMEAINNPASRPYHNTFVTYDMRGAQGVQIGDRGRQNNTFKTA